MASKKIHQRWQGLPTIFQKPWSAEKVGDEKGLLCAQERSPEAWEAWLNVPLICGTILDLPLTQGGSQAEEQHAENSPENQIKSPAQGTEADEAYVVLE